MGKIHDIKAERDKALEHARSIETTGTNAELRAASDAVEATQRALMAHIIEGAEPCPRCKATPIGLEQPTGRGGAEYEIGCPICTYFEIEVGGKPELRSARVVGGLLPKHAVELWNMGPEYWLPVPSYKEADARAVILREEMMAEAAEKQAAIDADVTPEKRTELAEARAAAAKGVSP